jgi:hypothetical protein
MVRERVGDLRLALAGVPAGLLVVTLVQTAFTAGAFDAAISAYTAKRELFTQQEVFA